ncbi:MULTISPECIES: DUF1376 domain-containing protein [Rhizobium]|uniref:DUF1376 domain-containing protein n=1 Tax=Rhizobium TaxID=379 RepID=UPI001C83544E|nr:MULTISPECIES: DUF1376 domain-containing protein [Rhizobium]MBX4952081.1 DUF1376 domain-containing protein [Rhizobium binae]MBX5238182.1 DUF1376 domain-containing protein [Rhizobium sp. NLR22b]MBX5276103.1 DUF1376 domain-containing protein [Rhizobium sp. NLR13a]MBX5305347.1 DUF1376 domain-containing protein [Rhizobium sp. NLR14b]
MSDELDVQCLPYMPLQIERLRRSKAWLRCKRNPEIAFYLMNLWMRAWHEIPAGSIEDDDDVLADAAMCSPAKWEELKDDILKGWDRRDGRVWHSTVIELATEAVGKLRTNKTRTAAAREARERQRQSSVTDTVTGNVTDSVTEHEGKGREEKGIENNTTSDDVVAADPSKSQIFAFEAQAIRLTEANLEQWRKAFPHVSLEAELWALDEWAGTKGKRWFTAVSGALAKKEREAVERVATAAAVRDRGGGQRRPDPRI